MTSDDTHGPGPGGTPPGWEFDLGPSTGPIGTVPGAGPAPPPAEPATPPPPPPPPPAGAPPPATGPVGAAPTGPAQATGDTGTLPVTGTGPLPVTGIGPRLTPESVRRAAFGRTGLGRRGYSETDVELFRNRVVQEIGQANAEKAELRRESQRLRAEIQRLRDYYRRQRIDVDRGGAAPPESREEAAETTGPSPDAVNVMSQAQQAADQHIGQAEDYARRLVSSARRQYDEILVSAQEQAERVAAEAQDLLARAVVSQEAQPRPAGEVEHLQERVAYLRTFAQVTQVQLGSILDGLRQELDKLALPEPEAPAPQLPPSAGAGLALGPATGPMPRLGATSTSPETGPISTVSTPPRGLPARGTLPVRS
jgi:cell division initiation protein